MLKAKVIKKNNKLDDLIANIKKSGEKSVEVGHFAEQGMHYSGMTYPELMEFHYTGSPDNNIPARPILRVLSQRIQQGSFTSREQLDQAIRLLAKSKYSEQDIKAVLNLIGVSLVKAEKEIFGKASQDIPSNAPITIGIKGKDAPLVDTGSLRDKVAYRTSKDGSIKE